MTVDKIISEIAASPAGQESIDKTRKAREEKATRTQNHEAARSIDNAELSSKARKLQETERILRFALERLEQFDDVRHEKLEEVSGKLQSDFYFTDQFNGEVSERLFSDAELQEKVRHSQQMRQYLGDVRRIDEQMQSEEIDQEKIDAVRQRVKAGFYDSEEVLGKVADRLLELTE
ncbi:MAG: flagellar biosynthesis anti-sigma factor FlgM [Candidatus Cloacimonetes bacterium]|nr:flagellar biosynthesis anti-sigma factor FlgM [Candidatus Cloacimonadota bacterium]